MRKWLILNLALWSSLALAFPSAHLLTLKSVTHARTVAALPVKLSSEVFAMQRMRSLQLDKVARSPFADNLPPEVNLGMNGVPVLDQGLYATCVTFAVTAALDAALNKGDHISQLCLLQLSRGVVQNTYWHSLWDGSSIRILLSYISQYGIMSIADQKKGYCNKIKTYPLKEEKPLKHKMTPTEYHAHSENIYDDYQLEPQELFVFAHAYSMDSNPDRLLTLGNNSDGWITPAESFAAMRKSLAEGNRVVIQFLFKGSLLRGGIKNMDNDTWFASNELRSVFNAQHYITDSNDWYIHDVVIYGYNDNITVRNVLGETQTGVFYARNSWGDEELEFMTYDFFKLMALEATSINTTKQTHQIRNIRLEPSVPN